MNRYSFIACLSLSAFAGSVPLFAVEPAPIYSEIQIDASAASLQRIGDLGIPVDHGVQFDGKAFSMPVSQYDLTVLDQNKIPYRVAIKDVARWYQLRNLEIERADALKEQAPLPRPSPTNWKRGSYGGYLNLTEADRELDEMKTKFPNLVSAKTEIGKSREGRSVYYIRISTSPEAETTKPRVVYNTITHAREPMAVMSMTYFLWTLLEGYATDANIKKLVDNVDIYYVPFVNPDGFEYNRSTNPTGGGMWRKNRHTNPDGTRGVDPNRNYGSNWGNDAGSSNSTSSDTYRGPSSFSEPETKNIRDFYLAKKFKLSSNFHTYANKLLHPYGLGAYPTNRTEYEALCREMTRSNGWQFGVVPPTIGYSASGIEIDWAHDVAKTLAVNPEMGSAADGGFYPASTRIEAIAASGLEMNMALARWAIPPVTGVAKDMNTPLFYAESKARGQWSFHYRLADTQQKWVLTVFDLQGKSQKRYELSPNASSLTLSRSEFSGSLLLLDVKACKGASCKTVHSQKLAMGGK